MMVICTFVIMYLDVDGLPEKYTQRCATCIECSELVKAYVEAGPPHWMHHESVVPGCLRQEIEAEPA